jgi:hypothetical protein
VYDEATATVALEEIRRICMALPEVTERLSHGSPTWFVRGKKTFVMYLDDHHGDGRLALWCAAPPDAQAQLVASDPDVFFVPAYVGHLGWVGVRLDRKAPWPVVARVIEDAHATRVTARRAPRAAGRPVAGRRPRSSP